MRSRSLMLFAWIPLFCIGAKVAAESVPDSPANVFSAMDVFELEWVTDPRVSPDGRTIAYIRNGYDIMTDRAVSRIWLIDSSGDRHRPLVERDGFGARWSPSGNRIAFLSDTPVPQDEHPDRTERGAARSPEIGDGRSRPLSFEARWAGDRSLARQTARIRTR